MSNWVFRWWRVRQLKKQINISHKLKLNTQRLKAECVSEIKNLYNDLIKHFEMLSQKINIKDKKLAGIDGDFRQKEIEQIKSKNIFFKLIVFLFIIAETGLYYLTAQVFIPIENEPLKLVLALFLGTVVMIILNWSVSKHFEYRIKISKREELGLTDADIKNARDMRIVGYVLVFISFFIILAAALVRIFYLEQMDLTGYTAEEVANLQKVGSWASYLTLGVTFALGIFLAFLKGEQLTNSIRYKEWKKWREQTLKLNKYSQDKIKTEEEMKNIYKEIIEKYWQLVKELERIWRIEYDEQDKELFVELKNLKRSGNFKIDEATYTKYEDVIYVERGLFYFGCERDSEVNKLIQQAISRLHLEPIGAKNV